MATGTITTAFGGYARAAMLCGFFASSSALSRLGQQRTSVAARSARRDIVQVAANGSVSTSLAALSPFTDVDFAYVGALAAVTGDTWATEIGRISGATPRHVLTGQTVSPGTSGGISTPGTIASLLGGSFIGISAAICRIAEAGASSSRLRQVILCGAIAGGLGSMADSVIGATVQERRWCHECGGQTELKVHHCGAGTTRIGGVTGINNDVVNLFCSITGAAIGFVFQRMVR